jgi:cytochrome c-type biogenesis protein
MGLVFIGFIPALQRQARFTPRRLAGLAGAPLLGAVFALGWTPWPEALEHSVAAVLSRK